MTDPKLTPRMQFVTIPTLGRPKLDIVVEDVLANRAVSNGLGGLFFATDTGLFYYDAGPPTGWVVIGPQIASNVVLKNVLLSSTAAISNTVAETAFSKTYAYNAGDLAVLGAVARWSMAGTYGRVGGAHCEIKMKFGTSAGATFADFKLQGNDAANQAWSACGAFAVVNPGGGGGTGQPVFSIGALDASPGYAATAGTQIIASTWGIDFTLSHSFVCTAQWSAASASNTIQIDSWMIEYLYPQSTTA